jgi:hypothetical protein
MSRALWRATGYAAATAYDTACAGDHAATSRAANNSAGGRSARKAGLSPVTTYAVTAPTSSPSDA